MGWEPAETTTVTRWDAEGRPVEWITEREPEWDDAERDIMAALAHIEHERCPRGHDLSLMTEYPPSEWSSRPELADLALRVADIWCIGCHSEQQHHKAAADLNRGLEGTDADEEPGRYSIVTRLKPGDAPTD